MADPYDFVECVANQMETLRQAGEDDQAFRLRLSKTILERTGDAFTAFEVLHNKPRESFTQAELDKADFFNSVYSSMSEIHFGLKGDSFKSMDYMYYSALLERVGFEKHLAYEYIDPYSKTPEEYSIWFRSVGALLLTAETKQEKLLVLDSMLYCELDCSRQLTGSAPVALERLLKKDADRGMVGGNSAAALHIDPRSGLVQKLDLLSLLNLNSPWKYFDEHHVYLLDMKEMFEKSDRPVSSYNDEKFSRLPLLVRQMIGYAGVK